MINFFSAKKSYTEKIKKKLTAKTFFDGFLLAAVSMFFKNPMGPRVHIYGTVHSAGVCVCGVRERGGRRRSLR